MFKTGRPDEFADAFKGRDLYVEALVGDNEPLWVKAQKGDVLAALKGCNAAYVDWIEAYGYVTLVGYA